MSAKLIGYARVSTTDQDHSRQVTDLLNAGVRRDDIYEDKTSGAKASRPGLDKALTALQEGDTLVVTTLDRLGRSTSNMLTLAEDLKTRGVGLQVLNLGGDKVDTSTPMGRMVFTVMAALAEMEREIKNERSRDSVAKRRALGGNLGGRPEAISEDTYYLIVRDIERGVPAAQACRERGVSRATFYRKRSQQEQDAA